MSRAVRKYAASALLVTAIAIAIGAGSTGCADPVHDDAVAALGGEKSGESPGPTHRAGQPCLVCHGGSGPANAQFIFAGTVYQTASGKDPLVDGDVTLEDSTSPSAHDGGGGSAAGVRHAKTNSAGNFYLRLADWTSPAYPIHVTISTAGADTSDSRQACRPDAGFCVMQTHVGKDGSCASCHTEPLGPRSPGHVFLVDDTQVTP